MNNQACDDAATRNPRKAYTDYENSTYTVVSKVAYLIGVQKRIFENEYREYANAESQPCHLTSPYSAGYR